MLVKIYDNEKELLVQTISLVKNNASPLTVILFHCTLCRESINQIQGTVASISAGLTPTDLVTIINRCKSCGTMYTFQSSLSYKKKAIKITLIESRYELAFHCYKCRMPLFTYKGSVVTKDSKQISLNDTISCDKCLEQYMLNDIVSSDMATTGAIIS